MFFLRLIVDAEGFQFTLRLPQGESMVRDDEGFAEASLSTERTTTARTNTFARTIMTDGALRVMGAYIRDGRKYVK